MNKQRVAVLRGGPGAEYDVSMQSGAAVLSAIDSDQFQPVDVVVMRDGGWLRDGFTRYPEHILSDIDVVFVAIHGAYGEDGEVQKLLERLGVRYVGSGPFASKIAINKPLTKDFLREYGIRMAPHIIVSRESLKNIQGIVRRIDSLFGPSYILKPLTSGSSIGVVVAENIELLPIRLKSILTEYSEVLVEERIMGKEATCGILERFRKKERYVLPLVEIIPPTTTPFFSSDVKYSGTTKEICPGNFTTKEKEEIENMSLRVHQALGLRHFSRSDFMVRDGNAYFLEVNTIPGLTPESLFPKAMEAVGSNFKELIRHLLTDALEQRRV